MVESGGADGVRVEGTGSIVGRVVTLDLDEVSGAAVVLSDGASLVDETRTVDDGTYRLDNIEPGDYRIQVNAICCKESVQIVTVVADDTVGVDMRLEPYTDADMRAPYRDEFQWNGLLACGYSVNLVVTGLAGDACSTVDSEAERTHPFELEVGIKTLTAVLVWDATGGVLGEQLQYGLARDPCGGTQGTCLSPTDYFGAEAGTSPLYLRIDGGSPQSFKDLEEPLSVQLRVFPPFSNPDLYYQQKFTVYYTLHYNQEAPEDWDDLPDL